MHARITFLRSVEFGGNNFKYQYNFFKYQYNNFKYQYQLSTWFSSFLWCLEVLKYH